MRSRSSSSGCLLVLRSRCRFQGCSGCAMASLAGIARFTHADTLDASSKFLNFIAQSASLGRPRGARLPASRHPGRPTSVSATTGGFVRRVGLFQATAINISQMCGIGPFVMIPLMVAAFGGPQAIIGFVAGALLALADGLIGPNWCVHAGLGGSYVHPPGLPVLHGR